jgi:DNA-binding transcriptional ArsR family regulator
VTARQRLADDGQLRRQSIDSRRAGTYFHIGLLTEEESRGPVATAIDEDRLSDTFAALANTTRRAILARLARGAATVNELAEPFDRGRQAQYRPCALDAAPLREVSGWAEQYRPIWEARLARMDDYLQQLQSQAKGRQTR